MKIAKFVKTTLRDWEGKNACMILLSGCNFRCPYCNVPDLIENYDEDGITVESVSKYIENNKDFLEAAVISGGEPTIHPDLYKLIRDIKQPHIKIKLDTNGSRPDILDDLIGAKLVDKVCINIMSPLDTIRYSEAAGTNVDVENIRRSLDILKDSGISYDIRTTVVPNLVTPEIFGDILKDINGAPSLIIQQFDPRSTLDPSLRIEPYPEPVLVKMAETAKNYVRKLKIRGF